MQQSQLYLSRRKKSSKPSRKRFIFVVAAVLLALIGFVLYKNFLAPTTVEQAADQLRFEDSVSEGEKEAIRNAIRDQSKTYRGTVSARVDTTLALDEAAGSQSVLTAYVPVTQVYSTRQNITKEELNTVDTYMPADTDDAVRQAVATTLGVSAEKLKTLTTALKDIPDSAVAFVPASELSPQIKLVALDGVYYLDSFRSGAVFRTAVFSGGGAGSLNDLALNNYSTKDTTLKVNMTGVTALTRDMMKKLPSVGNATYFSEKIGAFLADADITHVSNEVSFKPGCTYSTSLFCSPPEMIETLKASGVDLVELTGNHNNDLGRQYNTDTINQYHQLGWGTFGGGLNAAEAAKPFIANQKGSKIAFLVYNYPDAPTGGAIATASAAGANAFNASKLEADIAAAHQQADFVIVDIQFWECYSYPDGYVEFPECDVPIGQQTSVFRQVAKAGADMVIGTQAHQPQTYEIYDGTPIYYGLGNQYFEQTRWPGTERGIILTHYFADGKLLQTKLSPTVYDKTLQTRLMDNDDASYLLKRLNTARQTAL